ncbi:transposase family protein [Streptomyces sp. H10-C2]|uniref:transposase family protein n=1 Tax=unclassified Streptomyces TaxID=2593676 RepID=UPI0024BA91F2|nr:MULTISPECIES: transposase family protein [unclassified Streptomyces]MDJ0345032.1 transposase family protein [Streptomyces sp. PH10-H1]MDJ0370809.1 transposase family protein [Streptomyces sp. H10-C2]
MQADASFWNSQVFDGIDDVDVEAVTAVFSTVDVVAKGRAARAACPDCGCWSDRLHDSDQRRLKDLPLGGQSVLIHLPAFPLRHKGLPASYFRRALRAADRPVRALHHAAQPRPGACRARSRPPGPA